MPAFIEPKTSYSFFGVQFVVETMGKDCFYKKQPVLNERAAHFRSLLFVILCISFNFAK